MTISKGNIKTGRIPAVSLPPFVTCPRGIPCAKDCYFARMMKYRPSIKVSVDRNYDLWSVSPDAYFAEIAKYLAKHQPAMFRFHIGGDIPCSDYARRMFALARAFPAVKFLAFTKATALLTGLRVPDNFSVVASMWPGMVLPPRRFPRAFMQDGTETRQGDAIHCPGNCETCGMCWSLRSIGRDVVFNKH